MRFMLDASFAGLLAEAYNKGQRIEAIKLLRTSTGPLTLSLIVSKRIVEALARGEGVVWNRTLAGASPLVTVNLEVKDGHA